MKSVSIIIPVYNEEATVTSVIKSIQALNLYGWKKELIVVDDGSTDRTYTRVKKTLKESESEKIVRHKKNRGKGAAVRTGIKSASGSYILIQDADLEYRPSDIIRLLQPITHNSSEVVYGTRLKRLPNLMRDERTPRFLLHYFGNRFLSFLTGVLHGQFLTDIETGYKVFPRKAAMKLHLRSTGFEFEPEITIRLLQLGYSILEVPIRTMPRGYAEGKKLRTIPDGVKALKMILNLKK